MVHDKFFRRMAAGCILFVLSLCLLFGAKHIEGMADWYSEHIYKVLVSVIGRVSGIVPFSLSEVGIFLLLVMLVVCISKTVTKVVRRQEGKGAVLHLISGLFLGAGILFFLYTVNCGVNYERESFSESSGIQTREYTAEELKEVCIWLTEEVNRVSSSVERDSRGAMTAGEDETGGAVEAMEALGEIYPELAGYYPIPKGLINSWILSVQNLTGIYLPFTIEANYNRDMPDYNIPFTACHELSHLRGFMQEQEANFIAWLGCTNSERVDFQYSGKLLGWIYCMNVLHKTDYEAYQQVRELLEPAVEADITVNHEFWEKYDGRIAEVANQINDTYLKANGQEDGVKSYDRMVDLIVAYYFQHGGE